MVGVLKGKKEDIDAKEKALVEKGYSRVSETVPPQELKDYQYKRSVNQQLTFFGAAPSESIVWRSPKYSPSI